MRWQSFETSPKTWKWALLLYGVIFVIVNLPAGPHYKVYPLTVASLISLLAMYGLGYEKAIGAQMFWKVVFWVLLIIFSGGTVIGIFFLLFSEDRAGGTYIYGPAVVAANGLLLILAILYFGIQLRGIYLYSYRSAHLWTRGETSP